MSARNAYSAARRAHSATGPLPCPCCGVEQPPEAVRRAADGTIRSECVACDRKRNAERMKQRRADAIAAATSDTKTCTKCFQTLPLDAFSPRSDSAGLRTDCRKCRSTARSKLKQAGAAKKERGEHGRWVPQTPGSALSEANIAADLYAQALRALATSPPLPVWEREEFA